VALNVASLSRSVGAGGGGGGNGVGGGVAAHWGRGRVGGVVGTTAQSVDRHDNGADRPKARGGPGPLAPTEEYRSCSSLQGVFYRM